MKYEETTLDKILFSSDVYLNLMNCSERSQTVQFQSTNTANGNG